MGFGGSGQAKEPEGIPLAHLGITIKPGKCLCCLDSDALMAAGAQQSGGAEAKYQDFQDDEHYEGDIFLFNVVR